MEYTVKNVFDRMNNFWVEIADAHYTQRQLNFLKRNLSPNKRVLDVACGTCRHTIPMSKAGFDMVGIDISMSLLRIAKQHGASEIVRSDMRFLPFKTDAFFAVISMDTSFGYLPSIKEDKQSLAEIHRVLVADGEFVLDMFNYESIVLKYADVTPLKQWEYHSFFLEQKRTISKSRDRLYDIWVIKSKTDGKTTVFEHSVRLYQNKQLQQLVANEGFIIEAMYGNYENELYMPESLRFIIFSRKN